ncbi:hypothetical protein BJV78DRAFT_1282898 [Lactifluus subvellereus]|nr:hypothetical protein BJV78DRAFT_1282898 [Lactifluus subvellereus]
MPKLEEALIDKLTIRPEVRKKARALLRAVHSRTGPGTGYDIGEGKTGVPAICAFIASKNAGYADITEEIAQKASCLAPKTFTSTFRTINTVLNAPKTPSCSPSKSMDEDDPTTYATLISEHKIGQPLRVESWMKEAQAALVALPRFQRDFSSRLTESGAEVRTAVFVWVCKTIKLSNVRNNYMSLVDRFGVSLKIFTRLVGMMEDECVDLKESISKAIKEMRKKKAAEAKAGSKTPTSTPSQSRSASPTKSALRNANLTPSLPGSAKRKVAFSASDVSASEDDDGIFAPPETPSKRPRRTPHTSSAVRELPVRARRASSASSEEAEDVEMPDVPPPLVASEPVAGPSTPRTPKTTPTHAYRTPPSARIQALSFLSDDEEEETEEAAAVDDEEAGKDDALPLSRRFRPVFPDRAQWAQRAPRLARDRAVAEERMRNLVERWGYPFEALRRALAVTAPG